MPSFEEIVKANYTVRELDKLYHENTNPDEWDFAEYLTELLEYVRSLDE